MNVVTMGCPGFNLEVNSVLMGGKKAMDPCPVLRRLRMFSKDRRFAPVRSHTAALGFHMAALMKAFLPTKTYQLTKSAAGAPVK